ncbi:hypothetical protein GGD89_003050 [Roseospira visakhapatnamensis]|uniref:Uncharacterized protein n=1 Tax=Roseospira visakhapatnamensis TaxID=390880 RepID=A0A7W6RG77_9PROT|nr:hypothetical protein [Roseospira visakhapatnamensis]
MMIWRGVGSTALVEMMRSGAGSRPAPAPGPVAPRPQAGTPANDRAGSRAPEVDRRRPATVS